MHAAARHEVSVLGITLSPAQAELARRRVAERGLSDRIEIRLADYRELGDEPFDAVASIGMSEHVGSNQIDAYAETLAGMVQPGGHVLNHAIARLRHGEPEAGPFSERFVFPDAAPLHLSRVQHALERAGLVTDHVEGFPADYATTSATGPAGSTRTSTRRAGSPARSACACGAFTYARRGAASRAGSRASIRCWATGPDPVQPLDGARHLGPRRHVELAEQVAHVALHGLEAHEELAGDLAVGAPVDQQPGHLELALAQRLEPGRVRAAAAGGALDVAAQLAQLAFGGVAVAHGPAGLEVGRCPLELLGGALLFARLRERLARQPPALCRLDHRADLIRGRRRLQGPLRRFAIAALGERNRRRSSPRPAARRRQRQRRGQRFGALRRTGGALLISSLELAER